MYLLGDVTFQDMPQTAATPAVIVNAADTSLPGLAVVAGLALAVFFFLRRGRSGAGGRRLFAGGPKRRRNGRRRRAARRRKNVLVWGV